MVNGEGMTIIPIYMIGSRDLLSSHSWGWSSSCLSPVSVLAIAPVACPL